MEKSPKRAIKEKFGLILALVILVSLISFTSAWPLDGECTDEVLDIAIIIDSSESAQYEWNTLCEFKSELLDDLDEATDAELTFYRIGNSYTAKIPANCDDATAFWGDDQTSYNWEQRRDERGEFWAPAAQDVIDKHDWRTNSQKLIIVVSDSDPTGLQEGSGVNSYQGYGWRLHSTGKHSEGEILRRTRDAANDNEVTISVAGAKNIEECHKVWWGDDKVCNIYEAFEMISSQTGGTYLSHGRSDANDIKTDIQDIIQDFYKCEKPEPTPKPDLYIDNGNLRAAPVYEDSPAVIEFNTHNDKEPRFSVPVKVYLDGAELTFPTTLPFSGSTAQWSIDLGVLSAGQHTLEIITDPLNTIDESNEGNNYFAYNFEVFERPCPPEKPDLYIDGGYQTDSEIYEDEDADVRFMMHNTGDDNLIVTMQISLNGATIPTTQMLFNSGSRDWGVGLGQLPAGTYTLEIITDNNDNFDESNENNNLFTYNFEVLERTIPPEPRPDLYIDNGAVWCPPIRECEVAIVFFDTHNDDDPISSVDVEVYMDGAKLSAPNALPFTDQTLRKNINFGILPIGQHTLEIITDPLNTIDESNENNNLFTYNFEVLACPQPPVDEKIDLYIDGGYLPRPIILDNESAEVKFLKQNTGDDNLIVRMQMSLSGTTIPIVQMPFQPGITDDGIDLGQLEAGNYTLEIITDSDDSFDESNESNNVFTFDFEVTNTTQPPVPPVDDEAPIITIVSPEKKEYNVSDLTYLINTNEPVVNGWFIVNSGASTSMQFPLNDNQSLFFQQINLSNGNYTIVFYAEDSAGNIGSNSTTFSINVTEEEEKKEDNDNNGRGHREESRSINLNPQSGIGIQDVTITPRSALTLGTPAVATSNGSGWWIWILVLLAAIVLLMIFILLIVA